MKLIFSASFYNEYKHLYLQNIDYNRSSVNKIEIVLLILLNFC